MQLGNQHELGYKDFWIRLRVSSTGGEIASFFFSRRAAEVPPVPASGIEPGLPAWEGAQGATRARLLTLDFLLTWRREKVEGEVSRYARSKTKAVFLYTILHRPSSSRSRMAGPRLHLPSPWRMSTAATCEQSMYVAGWDVTGVGDVEGDEACGRWHRRGGW